MQIFTEKYVMSRSFLKSQNASDKEKQVKCKQQIQIFLNYFFELSTNVLSNGILMTSFLVKLCAFKPLQQDCLFL